MKKKRRGVVYSTDPNYGYDHDGEEEVRESVAPSQQDLRIRKDRLKGNKVVTVVMGYKGPNDELKDLGKTLKQLCGCGGAVKKGEIMLQGDFREKIGKKFSEMGFRYKLTGG